MAAGKVAPIAVASWLALAGAATAQEPPPLVLDPATRLHVPAEVAPQGRIRARAEGLAEPVRVEVLRGGVWRDLGGLRFRAPKRLGRLQLRGRGADGRHSPEVRLRVRSLRLAAVGDINFGDGPGEQIARYGAAYPWASVGDTLRAADIAFGNLECAVSRGGSPQPKQYVFRGRPAAVRAMRRHAGIDVVNLANNHAGDYGDGALLDTIRHLRRAAIVPVGAGASEAAAYAPQVVERLGLRVAFVGFSTILPFEFRAIGASPGTAWGFPGKVASGVRRAAAQADLVVATFHWGIERDRVPDARERSLARVALRAGATAVIGAHPHVLQPVVQRGRRLVAYSLGNFVFSAGSPGTQRSGILHLRLGRRRVLSSRLQRATIVASRPLLDR